MRPKDTRAVLHSAGMSGGALAHSGENGHDAGASGAGSGSDSEGSVDVGHTAPDGTMTMKTVDKSQFPDEEDPVVAHKAIDEAVGAFAAEAPQLRRRQNQIVDVGLGE